MGPDVIDRIGGAQLADMAVEIDHIGYAAGQVAASVVEGAWGIGVGQGVAAIIEWVGE